MSECKKRVLSEDLCSEEDATGKGLNEEIRLRSSEVTDDSDIKICLITYNS